MTAGGVIGVTAAFIQTLDKIQLLKNPHVVLSCNLNSIFSCTNVLNAWQSSVFGFPNSVMCLALFVIFTSIALVGLSGGTMPKQLRLSIQGLSLFTLGFALWFLSESIFVISSLCILCIFCFIGLLMVNWSWLRLNAASLPIGERGRAALKHGIYSGVDTFAWLLLAILVAFAMIMHFR